MSRGKFWILACVTAVALTLCGLWWGTAALGRRVSLVLTQIMSVRLQQILPGHAVIGRITATPWSIALHSFQWNANVLAEEPLVQARRIMFQPSTGALLLGRLAFSRVTIGRIELTIVRLGPRQWNWTTASSAGAPVPSVDNILRRFVGQGQLIVQRFEIVNGEIQFEDRTESTPVAIHVQGLRLVIEAMPLPGHLWAMRVLAEGTVRVRPNGHESPFRVTGWLDPMTKDLELKFHIADVELGPLEPYYQGQITRVRAYEGRATLQGTAKAVANNLTMTCQVTLSNLQQGDISMLGRTIVDVGGALNAAQGTMSGEVLVRGPLDRPAQWQYQLGAQQAPLILLFVPFMQRSGETTVIKIGNTQLDVGSAIQQWIGPAGPGPKPSPVNGGTGAAPQPLTTTQETTPTAAPSVPQSETSSATPPASLPEPSGGPKPVPAPATTSSGAAAEPSATASQPSSSQP